MSAHDAFEAAARRWGDDGRPDSLLLSDLRLMALRCWSWSAGGKGDGMSPTLAAFMAASVERLPGNWLDDRLDERDACRRCGETFRLENLMVCTGCLATFCHRCGAEAPLAANGNRACSCGGELVG